tara:strand:- start:654 stop:974 length:321 start_codon:yes stop_codon:yes gene_type:complete
MITHTREAFKVLKEHIGDEDEEVLGESEPIPLTEEWLLKFGFNYNDDDCVYLALKYRGFCIYSDDYDEFSIATIKVQNFRIVIKHVHQLQNLYFFLTTEELTIKEK